MARGIEAEWGTGVFLGLSLVVMMMLMMSDTMNDQELSQGYNLGAAVYPESTQPRRKEKDASTVIEGTLR